MNSSIKWKKCFLNDTTIINSLYRKLEILRVEHTRSR